MGLAPREVSIRIWIDHVTEKMWCPETEVEWPDGTKSSRKADCVDFEPGGSWSDVYRRWLGQGEHTIRVRVKQGAEERLLAVKVDLK